MVGHIGPYADFAICHDKRPEDWKSARVTTLFKQGDRDDINNYRPISVIPEVVKVFDRIVYEQLHAYLEEHDILCKHQSGFRAIHLTVTTLFEATDSWAYYIDIGNINAAIFLDVKKAFDTIDHEILSSKFDFYGISENSLKINGPFNRIYRTVYNNAWLVGPYLKPCIDLRCRAFPFRKRSMPFSRHLEIFSNCKRIFLY